jgi:hypothetical protein
MSIFDIPLARESRNEAINKVDANTDAFWKKAADWAVGVTAMTKADFSTDDVWEQLHWLGVQVPHEPRALGAVMVRANRLGQITPTDRIVQSKRPECHARPVRVWKSALVE